MTSLTLGVLGSGSGSNFQALLDATAGKLSVLRFKAGVAASEVRVTRSGDSLVLSIAGTADSVTLQNYFHWNTGWHPVQEVQLSNGAVISSERRS